MHHALFFLLFILLFIAGMAMMRTGLMMVSGKKFKYWLESFTSTPWKGLLLGLLVTILLQSSSAVMVLTIGLVSAGQLSLPRTIGIVLGTNIGTTTTLEFLAYGSETFIFPLLATGTLLVLFSGKRGQPFGLFCYGLGAIFLAMYGFERLAHPLSQSEWVYRLLNQMNESSWLSVAAGTLITAIIQSSTAMTGIAMGFLRSGLLSLSSGIGLMLGANIGTCADAYIASIGSGREAKFVAYFHIWLNVFGVLLFFPFLDSFTRMIASLGNQPEQQLAHAGVLFNVIVSVLVLPFAKPIAAILEKWVPKR